MGLQIVFESYFRDGEVFFAIHEASQCGTTQGDPSILLYVHEMRKLEHANCVHPVLVVSCDNVMQSSQMLLGRQLDPSKVQMCIQKLAQQKGDGQKLTGTRIFAEEDELHKWKVLLAENNEMIARSNHPHVHAGLTANWHASVLLPLYPEGKRLDWSAIANERKV